MKSTFLFTVMLLFLNGYSTIFSQWKNLRKSSRVTRFLMELEVETVDYKSLYKNVESQTQKNLQYNNIVGQS